MSQIIEMVLLAALITARFKLNGTMYAKHWAQYLIYVVHKKSLLPSQSNLD
jgi:hypothetical protein